MKELSIEQKAKAYDKAKYIMKEYLESGNAGVIAENTIKKAFPELSESEDDKIRKALIDGFTVMKESKNCGNTFSNHNIPVTDILAWLEKQAQKPDTNCLLSWSETDEKMFQSLEGIVKDYSAKAEQEKNEIKIREASNVSYFLKTIQKSPLCWIKCSDGLPNKDGIYLVVTDGRYNDVYDMARYDSIEGWHKASEIIYWMPIPQLNNQSIIKQKPNPCDGCINRKGCINCENGELREVEHKSGDKVEPKFKVGDEIKTANEESLTITKIDEKGYWSEDLFICGFEEECIWNLVEKNPTWSEEDEKRISSILLSIEYCKEQYPNLREYQYDIDWLKSLKERYSWKPSDEQMLAINTAINVLGKGTLNGRQLVKLREELQKLREE